jgi:hypothetical protein
MTSYEEIYNRFLQKCSDFSLAKLPGEDIENMLRGWLKSAVVKFMRPKSDLSQRDDELRSFTIDLQEYEKEVLALMMVREWLRPQIASTTLTLQRYSKKEGYSQKEHLSGLIAFDETLRLEIKKLLRDESYANNDYFG